MAFSLINDSVSSYNWGKIVQYGAEFLCDERSEVSSLPTSSTITDDYPHGVPAGSTALVAADSSIWILNNSDTWVELFT